MLVSMPDLPAAALTARSLDEAEPANHPNESEVQHAQQQQAPAYLPYFMQRAAISRMYGACLALANTSTCRLRKSTVCQLRAQHPTLMGLMAQVTRQSSKHKQDSTVNHQLRKLSSAYHMTEHTVLPKCTDDHGVQQLCVVVQTHMAAQYGTNISFWVMCTLHLTFMCKHCVG